MATTREYWAMLDDVLLQVRAKRAQVDKLYKKLDQRFNVELLLDEYELSHEHGKSISIKPGGKWCSRFAVSKEYEKYIHPSGDQCITYFICGGVRVNLKSPIPVKAWEEKYGTLVG